MRIERDNLIFIDEAGFNINQHRGRGRSRKGQKAYYLVRGTGHGGNISVIGAISPTKGLVHYQVRLGATTGTVYSKFIQELVRTHTLRSQSMVIVHDNCTAHLTDEVKQAIIDTGTQHEFKRLPPYSPQLNPIELMWSKLKYVVNERKDGATKEGMMSIIEYCLKNSFSKEDFIRYYDHVVKVYVDCMNKIPLV